MLRLLAIVAMVLTAAAVQGGLRHRCSGCGSYEAPRSICRVVTDVQLVTTYEYFSRSETFCVPGRSHCLVPDASPCEPTTDCGPSPKACAEKIWVPSAGPVYCRSKLCRRPVTVKKLCYKYIVEDVCGGCGHAQLNKASTEALQFARGLPEGTWQPLDERPSLIARPRRDKAQAAARVPAPTITRDTLPAVPSHMPPTLQTPTSNIELTSGQLPITTRQ